MLKIEYRVKSQKDNMKLSNFPQEKVNIYSSEMSAEVVESYEKYYKNLDVCQKEVDDKSNNKKLNEDKRTSESKINDTSQACATKLLAEMKNGKIITEPEKKRARSGSEDTICDVLPNKKKKKEFEPPRLKDNDKDIFCWRCHKYIGVSDSLTCHVCPRIFHLKCAHMQEKPTYTWLCTECDIINTSEHPEKLPPLLKKLKKNDLAKLLIFVLKRMRQHEGSLHFENPVDPKSYPEYKNYIIKPMYLSLVEENIKKFKYSSCESFLADTKWMVHNSYIFNTVHSELTLYAKAMMKNAKHECEEIMNCPDCYLHANTLEEDTWFIEPCERPHILVWARLKGFPYWPCKVMKACGTNVDVRFFGDHNKSLVPVECCYLYSKQMPSKQKKFEELGAAIKEANIHIKRLEEKYHVFQYATLKTLYNPKEEDEQRSLLLPYFDQPFFIKVKDKEKLFDPKVMKNIHTDSSNALEDDKCNSFKESSINLETDTINEKELSIITDDNINFSLNKPTIIIEENDSNILSQVSSASTGISQSARSHEQIISTCTNNKSKTFHENILDHPTVHKDDIINGMIPFIKNSNTVEMSNSEDQTKLSKMSGENSTQLNFLKKIGLTPGNTPEKKIILNSDKAISKCSNKSNNDTISDKLKINSNAKLINVIANNPSIIDNYIFKPMVVIHKLKDDVIRDYSNSRRKQIVNEKYNITNRNLRKKSKSSDVVENHLDIDLLNGNISDLVSLTDIDLENYESSEKNSLEKEKNDNSLFQNKKTKVNDLSFKPTIKSENVENPIDDDYVERLSKSILESTFDYEKYSENYKRDVVKQNDGNHNLVKIEDSESSNSVVDEALALKDALLNLSEDSKLPIKDTNQLHLENSLLEEIYEEQSDKDLNIINDVTSNLKNKTNSIELFTNTVKNYRTEPIVDKNDLKYQIIDENDSYYNSQNECVVLINNNRVIKHSLHTGSVNNLVGDGLSNKNPFNSLKQVEFSDGRNCGNVSCLDNKIHDKINPILNNIIPKENKTKLSYYQKDPDCEIVDIIHPKNASRIMKPFGLKAIKTSGGIIKKVLKNKIIMPSNRKQNIKVLSKNLVTLSPKSKFFEKGLGLTNVSDNCVMIHSKRNNVSSSNKIVEISRSDIEKKSTRNNKLDVSKKMLEAENMMTIEIDNILKKIESIESKNDIMKVVREELKLFEENCKKKVENYKSAYIEEIDSLFSMEKERLIQESISVSENESKMMIDEIKKKQWCVLCVNEAKFHCCWSTSYCSQKCQLADWPVHMKTCTQYTMRAGDPDLRLSPHFKHFFQKEPGTMRTLRIKDIVDSIVDDPSKITTFGSLKGNEIAPTSTFYLNQSPGSSKSTIYVPKLNRIAKEPLKINNNMGVSRNKPGYLTIPSPSRVNAPINIFKTSKALCRGIKSNNQHETNTKGGKEMVVSTPLLHTPIIKKPLSILAQKKYKEKNPSKAKQVYISVPTNIEELNIKHNEKGKAVSYETTSLLKETLEKKLSSKNNSPKPTQSVLIFEKNGDAPEYTYRVQECHENTVIEGNILLNRDPLSSDL